MRGAWRVCWRCCALRLSREQQQHEDESERLEDEELAGLGAGIVRLPTSWSPERGHPFALYNVGKDAQVATVVRVATLGHPSCLGGANCDELLGSPRGYYQSLRIGEPVYVGYSFLPLADLSEPGDGIASWHKGWINALNGDGRADVLYMEDGTVEEAVHPGRLRRRQDQSNGAVELIAHDSNG